MPAPSEVFFDPSGRRWRRIKVLSLVILASITAVISLSMGPVHAPPELDNKAPPTPPQPEANTVDTSPFIGTGPLARLVRVTRLLDGYGAVDPLTGAKLYTLTGADLESVGRSPYAIYRYGYDEDVHRTISLTFHAGPDPVWTPRILDVLGRNHVPATFFVIGSDVVRHSDLVEREKSEGHAVGNHTMTHPELSPSTIQQELVTTDRVIAATVDL